MTTKVHVVNYGPQPVEVESSNGSGKLRIYAQESRDFYVYQEVEIKINELRQTGENKNDSTDKDTRTT